MNKPPPPPPPSVVKAVSLWAALMPVFVALLSTPAHAQTEIWSAELTVGTHPGLSSATGYCLNCSISIPSNFGLLSDPDFEFSGAAYVVKSIR